MRKNKNKNILDWYKITSLLSLTLLIIVIFILGNISFTKVYKFDGSGEFMYFNNGLIIFTKDSTVLKISDFKTNKNINFNKVNLKLLVNDVILTEINDEFLVSKDLNDYLKTITINLYESKEDSLIFTKEIKESLINEGEFTIIISSDDNTVLEETVQLKVTKI